ncbi:MAG: pyridoxal 5'-phosphate synthase glutaminase subunit PdxT [Candidatus Zixiibacteriota bacterium]|nr:MAG: pyridoxal 5'-phosphate synthase glutaminase subunit PdxT [candidate division Zixibacteria bacterium]
MSRYSRLRVGVLALQGDFQRHSHQLDLLGVKATEVRLPADLQQLNALIVPGGESTTINTLIDRFSLREPLLAFGRSQPIWGTCAGMVILAKNVVDNQAGIKTLGLLDIDVVRVGYGRQVFSFEESITADLGDGPVALTATFIRAPKVTRTGPAVQSLAAYRDSPVLVSQGNILASSFHTELDDNTTLLEYFLKRFVGGD